MVLQQQEVPHDSAKRHKGVIDYVFDATKDNFIRTKNRAKFPSDIVSFIIQKKLFGIVCLYLDIIELIN